MRCGMQLCGASVCRGKEYVCGVVWCGVVWCGVVWCDEAWCGGVGCGEVWCGMVCYGVVWRSVSWCGVAFAREEYLPTLKADRRQLEEVADKHKLDTTEGKEGLVGFVCVCVVRRGSGGWLGCGEARYGIGVGWGDL